MCKPGYLNLGIDQCWIKIDDIEAAAFDTAEDSCPTDFHYQDYPSGRCIPNDPRIWRKERRTYIPYTNKYVCKPGYLNLGIDQCWIKIDDIEAAAFDKPNIVTQPIFTTRTTLQSERLLLLSVLDQCRSNEISSFEFLCRNAHLSLRKNRKRSKPEYDLKRRK